MPQPLETHVPILWIIGSVGTGKSATSYLLFDRQFRAGNHVARLDLDEIGNCHPAPDDDPENHRVKAAAMAAAWSVYEVHGATRFVVSGDVISADEVDLHMRQIPEADWCVVRLRSGADERRARIQERGKILGQDAETMDWWIQVGKDEEAALEAEPSFVDFTIDTDGLDRQQVVDKVLQITGWPASRPRT
jgi:hypothetical protein